VLAYLPFSPDLLDSVPDGLDIEVVDATEGLPASVGEVEFYVPAYQFSRKVVTAIEQMPRLKAIQSLTAGTDHITAYLREGMTLCNAVGVHDAATSELAVAMMIGAQRRFADLVRAQDRGEWDMQMTSSLADRRVLVIGAGSIANAISRRLDGFECEVTLVGRTAREGVRGVDELPALLPHAEIVVLIVPITDETRGLVDKDFLAAMPDDALLVNVARGPIVVTDDLLAELQTGRLRAALDVTDPEPLPPGHPLWSAPGVFITPHVGGASSALWPRAHRLVCEQLRRYSAGEALLHVVFGPDTPSARRPT
jgi:phosphoglycerate dehydrogenase-like enzyme